MCHTPGARRPHHSDAAALPPPLPPLLSSSGRTPRHAQHSRRGANAPPKREPPPTAHRLGPCRASPPPATQRPTAPAPTACACLSARLPARLQDAPVEPRPLARLSRLLIKRFLLALRELGETLGQLAHVLLRLLRLWAKARERLHLPKLVEMPDDVSV
eukprot:5778513-Prymnesium_polylepis.1